MAAPPPNDRNFFISRTGKDKDWAQWIAQVLEAASYTTFLQDWDFIPGLSFVQMMEEGAECERTIVVLSPEYLEAAFTRPEWRGAFPKNTSRREEGFNGI